MKPGEKIPPHTLARVTNRKMQTERDFEKVEAEGSVAVLEVLGRIANEWRVVGRC